MIKGVVLMNTDQKKLSLFALTWPIFIETLLYMVMGNADTLMLSLYSDHSVATVGVANQIISLVIVMFNFVALATAVLVAQYLGAEKKQNAVEVSLVSIAANFLFGLVLSSVLFFFGKPILYTMKLSNHLLTEANDYLMTLQAAGDVKFPVYMGILSMWGIGVTISYFLGIEAGLGLIGVWISFIADEWLRGLLMLWRWRSKV
jgi:Na+-driven multidrug efflux pump